MAKSEKPTPWYLRLWFIIPLGVLIFGGWLVIDLARGSDRGCKDDDRHVTDKQAGVCYEIPTGWEAHEDLADGFTSGIEQGDGSETLVGPRDEFISDEELGDTSVPWNVAKDIAEEYVGSTLDRGEELSHDSTTVKGVRIGTVSMEFDAGRNGTFVRVSVIELEDGEQVVMLSTTRADRDSNITGVDKAHDSLYPVDAKS